MLSFIEFLQDVELATGDFEEVELRDGDFVYADPPYRDAIVNYDNGFSESDQRRLANLLNNHQGSFSYSNKDIGDGFMDRFQGAEVHCINATYTAGRGTSTIKQKEVLVTRG